MKKIQSRSGFSKKFLWGAATAAHQVEGGNYNQWTVWELENAKSRAEKSKQLLGGFDSWSRVRKEAENPDNYISSNLAKHYERFEEDFDLLLKMNMNAYRFSVEWSRIEPERGAWNTEAVDHYRRYINELKKRNIEPVMTLFHFTLPVWFAEMGGFERRSNVKYFTSFAKRIVSELGSGVKFIITINEIEIYALQSYYTQDWPPVFHSRYKMWRVIDNLTYAHRQAADAIHKISSEYKVSIAKNSTYCYPGDGAWLSRVSASVGQYIADDYILKKVVKHCDFIGLNYYQSQRMFGCRIKNPQDRVNDLNWPMTPGDIQYTLERLYTKYKLPIIITENGLADGEDSQRRWWITETLAAMQKAMENGVKLEGYLHWSLMDNTEWAFGKWPRFGLTAVDYNTGKRSLRPSAVWFGGVIKKLRNL
jgi:beta-glucosidase